MQHTFLPNDIYLTVGKIIDQSLRFKSSINSLCYSSKFNNKKRLLALILKTLSFKIILDKLINDIPIVINTYRISRGVLYAVIYEHAFGKGHRNKFWRQLLQPFDKKIKAYIKAYMSEHKFTTKRSISKKMIKNPRFIRINTQKVSINDAIQNFISMGYKLVEMSFLNYTDFLKTEKALGKDEFIIDPLFKNLLSFHQSTDFHACAMAKNGQIILQDKASCIPPIALDPPKNSYVLDCCAAPGNKTSQLCDMLQNSGHLIAMDSDSKRINYMRNVLKSRNCNCHIIEGDFLKVDPKSYPFNMVEYILLDPSCTSSGVTKLYDYLLKDDVLSINDLEKARKLSFFQKRLLTHALSFPRLKSLVYSTCSIHEIENEAVVYEVYRKWRRFFGISNLFSEWPLRGLEKYKTMGKKCIRAHPEVTNTNGFFVAKFFKRSFKKMSRRWFVSDSKFSRFHDYHRNIFFQNFIQ